MKVSILTPCLNAAAFLPDAMESVKSQGGDLEHIVVDGGSLDGTAELLTAAERPGLKWISEPDRGQSDALNKGLGLASGDIIGWLNADEWYLPGAVQAARKVFEASPEVDVVYGEFFMVAMDGRFVRSVPSHRFSSLVLKRYGCFVPSCASFIRRRVISDAPWDVDLRWIMDWDLWLSLSKSGAKFSHVRSPLAAFRLHPGQVTAGDPRSRSHEWTDLGERYGIPPNARSGYRKYFGKGLHAAMKLTDGAYFRQISQHRRLSGTVLPPPSFKRA